MPSGNWQVKPGPVDYDGPEPAPDESLAAMEKAALAGDPAVVSTESTLDCPKRKYIELTLIEDDGGPLKNAKVTLDLPDGTRDEGITDDRGFVRFDGKSTDVEQVEVWIEAKEDESGNRTFHATVRAKRADKDKAAEEHDDFEEWSYHSPGWGGLDI